MFLLFVAFRLDKMYYKQRLLAHNRHHRRVALDRREDRGSEGDLDAAVSRADAGKRNPFHLAGQGVDHADQNQNFLALCVGRGELEGSGHIAVGLLIVFHDDGHELVDVERIGAQDLLEGNHVAVARL